MYRITDLFESFVLKVLCLLLVDGPSSPFHKSLLEANLGSEFSPGTGLVVKGLRGSFLLTGLGLRGYRLEFSPGTGLGLRGYRLEFSPGTGLGLRGYRLEFSPGTGLGLRGYRLEFSPGTGLGLRGYRLEFSPGTGLVVKGLRSRVHWVSSEGFKE